MTDKPRKLWIEPISVIRNDGTFAADVHVQPNTDEGIIPVVEYSAYEALRAENEKIKEQCQRFKNGYENTMLENQKLRSEDRIDPRIYEDRCNKIKELEAENERLKTTNRKHESLVAVAAAAPYFDEIKRLKAENKRLTEVLSYLPKVPTEPYEKMLAKKIIEIEAENAELREALEAITEPNGKLGIEDAELFEQYFTHVEPQPMGTPKTIFRIGHAQGMASLARIAGKALNKTKAGGGE